MKKFTTPIHLVNASIFELAVTQLYDIQFKNGSPYKKHITQLTTTDEPDLTNTYSVAVEGVISQDEAIKMILKSTVSPARKIKARMTRIYENVLVALQGQEKAFEVINDEKSFCAPS